MSLLSKVIHRDRKDPEPEPLTLEVVLGENARANRRRLARAERKAPIPVLDQSDTLSKDDQERLRQDIAARRGVTPDEVDLDEVVSPSGAARRRYARQVSRDQAARQRRAQRRFSRQQRAQAVREDKAAAIQRVLEGPDTPMRRNVTNWLDRFETNQEDAKVREGQRAARRRVHEARRAELGQTPDGRPA